MKPEIHPTYNDVKVVCSCGSVFVTRSTLGKEQLSLEVCAACHPFYTGTQKIVDTAGRVDRFRQKYAKAKQQAAAKPEPTKAAPAKAAPVKAEPAKAEPVKAAKATEAKPAVKKPRAKKEKEAVKEAVKEETVA